MDLSRMFTTAMHPQKQQQQKKRARALKLPTQKHQLKIVHRSLRQE